MRRSRAVPWVLLSLAVLCAACGTRGESADERTVAAKRGRTGAAAAGLGCERAAGCRARRQPDRRPGFVDEGRLSHRAAGSIKDAGLNYTIVNAGVSGDTSAGGVSRLDWALDGDVRVLIVALGGNDGLRGLPAAELTRNLSTIIERAQARQISVVLAGMEAPPNHGFDYTAAFHKVYPALAKKYGVPLVPFLLQGVGGITALNQPDGIHPTAEGARMVADNVWTVLKPVLEADSRRAGAGGPPGR